MAPLEGPVEVDADAIACNARVLVSECENKGGVITKAHAALTDTQAALRLAKEHYVGWQREVRMILQRVAPQ